MLNHLNVSFVGYCIDHKSYKLFHTTSHKLIASRDVVFREHADTSDKTDQRHIIIDNVEYVKLNSVFQEQELEPP